ncbi:Na+/H+ antiporter NhaA [Flavobacterium selenitireducens]|uniref:Na+/H+ antiporter NhaA n=1 Tax=Flavobacterium selenitireducens TaxID=2722704 RepID=UPI00168AF27B|nr:Na+/H+ antiporter NhaA [Flavobacterium selenitireducens]MBD3582644.1 Na+/H+ antiporter NhaA [Flavobacterium selenitireducens]
MRSTRLFRDFFASEKAGGLILILATAISLVIANSALGSVYIAFWETTIFGLTLSGWINDALMAVFFLLIGLELEREMYVGELSDLKKASLPIVAAIGGMIVPASIFLSLNWNSEAQNGAGIPMATDIAFAIGILSLVGKRVPTALKIFLTALAVIDDLGAILVIAVFYTDSISMANLGISLGIFGLLLVMNRLRIRHLLPYLIGGIAMWWFMHHSGIHATITGVLLAFAIPFGNGDEKSTSYVLQHFLHQPVAFLILPLFALCNTALVFGPDVFQSVTTFASLGIIIGLVIGKPLGIFSFAFFSSKMGWCRLPSEISWKQLLGAGMLAGIGFTMSIFIALLAYDDTKMVDLSKTAILIASLISGICGLFFLKRVTPARQIKADN